MVTAQSDSLKGMKLNVMAGVDLEFNKDGICEDIDPDIGVILYAHKNMTVVGLEGEYLEKAKARKEALEHQSGIDRTAKFSGIVNPDMERAKHTVNVTHTVPAGRVPKSVQSSIEASEAARAKRLAKAAEPAEEEEAPAPAPHVEEEPKHHAIKSSKLKKKH